MTEKKSNRFKSKICEDHPDEELKFYCTAHNDVICSICAVKRHKLCQDTLTFPETIERFDRERNNLFKALDNQTKSIDTTTKQKRDALETLSSEVGQIRLKLRNLRSTINRLIDKSESDLVRKADDIERQQTTILSDDIQALQDLSVAATKVKEKAQDAFEKTSQLNIIKCMAKVQNAYCEIERCTKELYERKNRSIVLEISKLVQEFVDKFDSLGTVCAEPKESLIEGGTDACNERQETLGLISLGLSSRENTSGESTSGTSESFPGRLPSSLDDIDSSSEADSSPSSDDMLTSGDDNDITVTKSSLPDPNLHVEEIQLIDEAAAVPLSEADELSVRDRKPIKSFATVDHGKPCWLYGIAYMPDRRLVITDVAHDSLQLYDSTCHLIVESRVTFTPWDVVAVSRNTIAVCSGGKGTINTFSIQNNEFVILKTLDVGSDCISLAFSNSVFTAGTRKGGVLISEDGEVISRIEKNSSSREVFRRADFLAVDDDSRNIFISNAWASKIVCVTPDGRKLWESQTKGSNPRGLLWHNDRLLVASRNQHKIIAMDSQGGFIDDVIAEDLEYPYAISLHPGSRLLAITQWDEKMSSQTSRTVKLCNFE